MLIWETQKDSTASAHLYVQRQFCEVSSPVSHSTRTKSVSRSGLVTKLNGHLKMMRWEALSCVQFSWAEASPATGKYQVSQK